MSIEIKNRVRTLDTVLQQKLNMNEAGFIHHIFNEGSFQAIYLRTRNMMKDKIQYSFFYDKYSKETFINNINYGVIFTEVNEILFRTYKQLNANPYLANFSEDDITILELPNFEKNTENIVKVNPIKFIESGIFNEKRFDEITSRLNSYLQHYIFSFFNNVADIYYIDRQVITTFPWLEWSRYIPGQTYFKAVIIMKLCDNPYYFSFINEYKSRLEASLRQGMTQYQTYYDTFMVLVSNLDGL